MNYLFTICGRAGSKGFKNKNLKHLNGFPIVYYTLVAIKLFSDTHINDSITVAVNTDSEDLLQLIYNQSFCDNIRVVKRKEALAGDLVGKIDVIKDTYKSLCNEVLCDAVVDLDITSPLRTVRDIENAIDVFNSDNRYDLVFSVVNSRRSPYFNMVEKKGDYYQKICRSDYLTRQQAPKTYEMNASIYIYSPAFLEKPLYDTILDHKCGISVMKDYLVLDIDSEADYIMMDVLHKYYCQNDSGIMEIYDAIKKSELYD